MESRPWFHQAVGDGDLLLPVWLELIGSNAELARLPTHSTPHSEKTVQDEVIASHITSVVSVWSWALHLGLERDQGGPRRASWQSFVLFLTWWQWGQVMSGGSGSVLSKRSGPLCLAWVAGLRGGMVMAQSYQRQRVGVSVGTPSGVVFLRLSFLFKVSIQSHGLQHRILIRVPL